MIDEDVGSQPPDRGRILRHLIVRRQQRHALHQRLGHQETVERVLVKPWQAICGDRMGPGDRELGVACVEQAASEQPRIDLKVLSAEAPLDGDLKKDSPS